MRVKVTPLDPEAEGSWDQMIELMEIGGRISEAFDGVANASILEKARSLAAVKTVIRPFCEALDGEDTDELFRKLSVSEVIQILDTIQAGGKDAVPPTSSATSPLQ